MMEKQKILFLSQRFLFPQDTGGKLRTSNILEHLNRKFSVTVISNVESPKDDPHLHHMDRLCDKFVAVPWIETKRYTVKFYWEVFKKSFSIYPVTMLNDYSPELEEAVLRELAIGEYDLAVCDFMQSTLNFKQVTNIPRVLFQHNVETTISQRHMQRSKNPISKLFWWLQFRKMFYHEKKQSNLFDTVIAVSDADKHRMEEWYKLNNVKTIPTGVDTDFYSPNGKILEEKQIVFVGAMDWLPNNDAMYYFLEKIFPIIQKQEPDVNFVIVGRNPSPQLERFAKAFSNVSVTGWVEDIRPYISDSAVFIVPIRIGGGTRMKIYEGMAMGKAIVSTTVGAEGLPLKHSEHIFFADDEGIFADQVIKLLRDKQLRKQIGNKARQYVYKNFRWEKVADVFAKICLEAVKKNRTV
jgi:sugar transferase (PEP-CTERM/EpsH1 system associated)